MTQDPRELWTPGAKQGATPTYEITLEELITRFVQDMHTIEVTAVWLFNERLYQLDGLLKEIQDLREDIEHWNQTKLNLEPEKYCAEDPPVINLYKLGENKYGMYNCTGEYTMGELRSQYPGYKFVVDEDYSYEDSTVNSVVLSDGENEPV